MLAAESMFWTNKVHWLPIYSVDCRTEIFGMKKKNSSRDWVWALNYRFSWHSISFAVHIRTHRDMGYIWHHRIKRKQREDQTIHNSDSAFIYYVLMANATQLAAQATSSNGWCVCALRILYWVAAAAAAAARRIDRQGTPLKCCEEKNEMFFP